MKGIILAGGTGSRLKPNTISVSKQLLPVFDKPMIYYPLSTLMLAKIRDVLIVTTPRDQSTFYDLLGDGRNLGMTISYESQLKPEGIAQALLISENFVGNESVCLILGDNIFHGSGLGRSLQTKTRIEGAYIFGYEVNDPHNYGVVEINSQGNVVSIEEKPSNPKSRIAIPGLYFFDNSCILKAKNITKSARNELEITSVLQMYAAEENLKIELLPRGTAWMDCGTPKTLNDAGNYIRAIEERQGNKIGSIEEIAWINKWITDENLLKFSEYFTNNEYSSYLRNLVIRDSLSI